MASDLNYTMIRLDELPNVRLKLGWQAAELMKG
jgi:hypothetical protein